VQIIALGL